MSATKNQAYSTVTCDEDKLKLGNQFILAFRNRDWDLLKSIITEDCTWSLPGMGELAGESAGPAEIVEKAKQFVIKLSLELNHIQYSLNCVALAIKNKTVTVGSDTQEHVATVTTLRDGKISGINSFFSDVAGVREQFAEWAN